MGCGLSRQSAPTEQTPDQQNGAREAPRSRSEATSTTNQLNTSGSTSRYTTRPNKPLRSPSPVSRCPPERALSPWTRTQLNSEREAFFDTRVTGDAQVWASLRLMCDLLRKGQVGEAQRVLDTAGCTCPSGRVKSERSRGSETRGKRGSIFDERGNAYDIPGWVVVDPDDIVEDEDTTEEKDVGLDGASDDDDVLVEDADRARRDEKGKAAQDVGEVVRVTARLSDRGTDVVVEVGLGQKVKVLVKRIHEKAGHTKKMRLIYLGKSLLEEKTLAEQGWQPGHVVNVYVFE